MNLALRVPFGVYAAMKAFKSKGTFPIQKIKGHYSISKDLMTDPFKRPLGATLTADGADFAIYSKHATAIMLCLFDRPLGVHERVSVYLNKGKDHVWHVHLPGVRPGQLYGYRLYGPYDPHAGHRFNFNKVLLDPYALAITGTAHRDDSWFGYHRGEDDLSFDHRDNALTAPKAVVIDRSFRWENDTRLQTPRHKTILYELHVRGFTKLFPGLPEELRGTYAGLAHPSVIAYLQRLGITAVELMPVQSFLSEQYLLDKGLSNYWGYNTIGFFSPYAGYSADREQGAEVAEFKTMVKALHTAGIEVILDVVYNHSAEADQEGPTLSFRGIDNAGYYRLEADKRRNLNNAGTGNRLNMRSPAVLRLILDSLRYWVEDMHVDGFRFDLAPGLSDNWPSMNAAGSFFSLLHADPVLSRVKLIAEPWDVGDGGYQLGNFYPEWSEWNDKYRDYMRDFWRPSTVRPGEFTQRFMGSPDLYAASGRLPEASLNLLTSHDGFTLQDLVSYERAHNEANGTNKTKSLADSRSWNCGVEGPTEDSEIIQCREQQKRNYLTTLLLSQGIPMLVAGDEWGRSQGGNDNAFSQDNPISWLDWVAADQRLIDFTARLIGIRKTRGIFQADDWTMDRVAWLNTAGRKIENWEVHTKKIFAAYFFEAGLFLAFNAEDGIAGFALPGLPDDQGWRLEIASSSKIDYSKDQVNVPGRSLAVLTKAG